MENNHKNWLKYIGNQTLPVFNSTIQTVIKLTADEKSSCKQLADMILRDASLTSRVIQIANTSYYNRGNTEYNSIRRIILLIGFKKIAEICLTLSILDSVTDKKTQKIIYKIVSKSFQAATHAYAMAELCNLKNSDQIYIAALLRNIGEIAYWSLTGKESHLMLELLESNNQDEEQLQEKILGTSFKKLSLGLAIEWSLSNLLIESLSNKVVTTLELKCIKFGYEITEIESDQYVDLEPIATFIASETKTPVKDVIKTIQHNFVDKRELSNNYL